MRDYRKDIRERKTGVKEDEVLEAGKINEEKENEEQSDNVAKT